VEIGARLQDLKRIVEMQDVTGLVLLLKEMIPDYNPTSLLLHEALLPKSNSAGKAIRSDSPGPAERTAESRLAPSAMMN
jgi:hypothetical protein